MGCGITMVKYLLFLFNLIVALCGLGILAIGIAFKLQLTEVTSMVKEFNVEVAPIIFIVVGSIVFIIAFYGCCGAIRESHCMTVTYAIFLIVLLIIQIAIAVLIFVYMKDINTAAQKSFAEIFDRRETDPAAMELVDVLQRQFECCGSSSKLDYITTTNIISLPKSCCATTVAEGSCHLANGFNTGCKAALNSAVELAGKTTGAVALGVAGVQIIGAVFALCLASSIRNQDRRSRY